MEKTIKVQKTRQLGDGFKKSFQSNIKRGNIEQFNQYREDLGFIEESDPDESWQEFTEFEIEPELYIQVLVGLEFDNQDIVFARILISRDKAAPFVHAIWKQ